MSEAFLRVSPGAPGAPVRLQTRAGLIAPRILSLTEHGARIALVATGALLLAGDDVTITVRVDDGVALDLVDVAATVAYAGRGGTCRWSADLHIASRARLTWLGEPLVAATDAQVTRRLTAQVAQDAGLVLRDTLVLGRSGEAGGVVHARTDLRHGGRPVLVEAFDLAPDLDGPGVRGGHRVVDQVTMLGGDTREATIPDAPGLHRFDLVGGGTFYRWLGDDAHLSPFTRTASVGLNRNVPETAGRIA